MAMSTAILTFAGYCLPGCHDDVSRYLAFMGRVFFCQSMFSSGSWMLSCAFGFLLASQFRSDAITRARIAIKNTPQAIVGEQSGTGSY